MGKKVVINLYNDINEKDYMLYLEIILQDDILARTESKKYSTLNKLSELSNIYSSFIILLVDESQIYEKIIYNTKFSSIIFIYWKRNIKYDNR